MLGTPTRLERDDPYLGFAGDAPLYVEERAPDGASLRVTAPAKRRFFNLQRFADPKPAGVKRAFCLGGSTTYGHPYDDATSFCGWLRALLPYADPGVRWEVINAGGISYASYRVARLTRELVRYEPDLFVVYTGHNEFLEARTYTSAWLRDPRLARLGSALAATRVFSLVSLAAEGLSSRPLLAQEVDALLDAPTGLGAYRRDDALRRAVVAHFRESLARIVTTGRGADAKVVLIAPASNLADFAPFKSEGPAERDAGVLYAQARALLAQGRAAEADAAFARARDEDVCPLRAIGPLVDAVREVAAAQRAPLVDFEQLLAERMGREHGRASPGAESFLDHVHPTVAANRLLALALVDALRAAGEVARAPAESELERVTRQVEGSLDEGAQGRALRRLAKVLSWAGKDEEAARLAGQAEAKLGGDAESRFILGSFALAQRRYDEAVRWLESALELDPDDARARVNLGIAFARRGERDAARREYDAALALDPTRTSAWLARGLLRRRDGDLEGARGDFERALALDPGDVDARFELGLTLLDLGQRDAAAGAFREVLAREPGDAEARRLLDEVLVGRKAP